MPALFAKIKYKFTCSPLISSDKNTFDLRSVVSEFGTSEFCPSINLLVFEGKDRSERPMPVRLQQGTQQLVTGELSCEIKDDALFITSFGIFKFDIRTQWLQEALNTENLWCLGGLDISNSITDWEWDHHYQPLESEMIEFESVHSYKFYNARRKEDEQEDYMIIRVVTAKKQKDLE